MTKSRGGLLGLLGAAGWSYGYFGRTETLIGGPFASLPVLAVACRRQPAADISLDGEDTSHAAADDWSDGLVTSAEQPGLPAPGWATTRYVDERARRPQLLRPGLRRTGADRRRGVPRGVPPGRARVLDRVGRGVPPRVGDGARP